MSVRGGSAFLALTRREVVRVTRQPSRVVAALGTPLLIWLFLASGFAGSFAPPPLGAAAAVTGSDNAAGGAASYAAWLLPGMITLVVMFSAIFSSISLIEDRNAGFLQSAIVSPAPRWSVLGAKIAGASVVACAQASILIVAAPFVGLTMNPLGWLAAVVGAALTAVAIASVGLACAWWVNSSQGFHGVMNMLLMPMWLLSGAFFPAEGASNWLSTIMFFNPLRWSTDAIRLSLTPGSPWAYTPWLATIGFALFAAALALLAMRASEGVRHDA